jgi:uncharacterized protein (TIGR02145 family)
MKKANLILTLLLGFSQIIYSQTVIIGSQVWTSTNLNVSTYRNGDIIPQVKDKDAWAGLTTGAWCYYENDAANGTKYGKLYNWYAVNDARGLAPKGYHIPSDAEWTKLTDYLGGRSAAGTKMKSAVGWRNWKTSGGWIKCPNCSSWSVEYRKKVPCHNCKDTRSVSAPTVTNSGNGSNSSKFSGLPGGLRYYDGEFDFIASSAVWWSSTEGGTNSAWGRGLRDVDVDVNTGTSNWANGKSVRCLKD